MTFVQMYGHVARYQCNLGAQRFDLYAPRFMMEELKKGTPPKKLIAGLFATPKAVGREHCGVAADGYRYTSTVAIYTFQQEMVHSVRYELQGSTYRYEYSLYVPRAVFGDQEYPANISLMLGLPSPKVAASFAGPQRRKALSSEQDAPHQGRTSASSMRRPPVEVSDCPFCGNRIPREHLRRHFEKRHEREVQALAKVLGELIPSVAVARDRSDGDAEPARTRARRGEKLPRSTGGQSRQGSEIGVPNSMWSADLYPWQRSALLEWADAGYQGIVEAVTGAGKTRVAIQAAADALQQGLRACVLVPTIELQNQWAKELKAHLSPRGRGVKIARLGGGDGGSSCDGRWDVLLATVQTGSRVRLLPQSCRGLLIADEVHRYGAPEWANALEPEFERRLGLTATYEREDNGIEEHLNPYFHRVVYRVGYRQALDESVICHFRIAFVGVRFSPLEQDQYDEVSEKASRYRRQLVQRFGVPSEPFGAFMREVQKLSQREMPEGSKLAKFYLSAFAKRRAVMAESGAKVQVVRQLAPVVRMAERSILFAQTKSAAANAVECLSELGVRGAVLSSGMNMDERRAVFAEFEEGKHEMMAAPRLLDEGVDVPAADLAIVLATSRSKRQLIQRMGRVLRRKQDGRHARIAILYVRGTAEDPDVGAHEDFLEEVLGAADHVAVFRAGTPPTDLIAYLAPEWSPSSRPDARRTAKRERR